MATKKIWLIAYVNRDNIKYIDKDLHKYDLNEVEYYVPTVKVLKKQFKGEQHFEEVPMLFNYGFFKVPVNYAGNIELLNQIRSNVSAIYGWVRDIAINGGNGLAIAHQSEIKTLRRQARRKSIYSKDDIHNLKTGMHIKLHGYPFDDMPAEVIRVHIKRQEVEVRLGADVPINVTVNFDNVFYSVYSDFDPEQSRDASLDELSSKPNNTADKLQLKMSDGIY